MSQFKFTEAERDKVVHALSGETNLQKSIDRIERIVSERSEWVSVDAAEQVRAATEAKDKEIETIKTELSITEADLIKHGIRLAEAKRRISELEAEISNRPFDVQCDACGNHPTVIVRTEKGRFCKGCVPVTEF